MENVQPVQILGNVGSDPEMRSTPNGHFVTNINIATHAGKDLEGNNLTAWVRVTFWNELAEKANNTVKKGMRLLIGGQLLSEPRLYENKAGEQKCSYELTGFTLQEAKKEYSFKDI